MSALQEHPRIVLVALALLLALQIGPLWYAQDDACSYLSIARSIARGSGPTNLGSPHLWFAPGYPLILSPVFLCGDRPFLLLSLYEWLLLVGTMLGVYVWARRALPEAALWITALSVVNCVLWIQHRRLMSEVAFTCVALWTANCLYAAVRATRPRWLLAGGVATAGLTALMCLIRPPGIAFAAGFSASLLLAGWKGELPRRRAWAWAMMVAFVAGGAVLAVVARERLTAAAAGRTTYLDFYADSARSFTASYPRGVQICITEIGEVTIPGMFKCYAQPGEWLNVNTLVYLALFAVVLVGWWKWVKRRNEPLAWVLPFYIPLIAALSCPTGGRYFVPMLPVLFACLWFALERFGPKRLTIVQLVLALHLAVAAGYWLGVDLPRARALDRQWPAIDALAEQVRADPGPVARRNLDGEVHLLLQFTLDRPVPEIDAAQPPGASGPPRWIMSRDPQTGELCWAP